MLNGISFKINESDEKEIEVIFSLNNIISKNIIILCANQKLVDKWKQILLDLKKDQEYDVGVEYSDDYEDFYKFCEELIIREENDYISIIYPKGNIQNFYISTKINIVYYADDPFYDVLFQYQDEIIYLCEFKRVREYSFDKDKIYKWIKEGRFGYKFEGR